MEQNPYTAPSSDVVTQTEAGTWHAPVKVPAGNSINWLQDGFNHFSQDAVTWILILIVGLAITLAVSFIPYFGSAAQYSALIWTAGLMAGCAAQDQGRSLNINHLFAGFSHNFVPLLTACVVVGVVSAALGFLVNVFSTTFFSQAVLFIEPEDIGANFNWSYFVLGLCIYMLLILPVMAAVWFLPALVMLNNIPPIQAMSMSFRACLINFWPLFVYSLLLGLILIVAVFPIGLGLLVAVPLMYGSIYRSYKDIFIN
jgi:hypothetical protein